MLVLGRVDPWNKTTHNCRHLYKFFLFIFFSKVAGGSKPQNHGRTNTWVEDSSALSPMNFLIEL